MKEIPPIDNEIINDNIQFDIEEFKEKINNINNSIKNEFENAFESKIDEIFNNKSSMMRKKIDNDILEFTGHLLEGSKRIINNELLGVREDSCNLAENIEAMDKAMAELNSLIDLEPKKQAPIPKITEENEVNEKVEDKKTIKFKNENTTLEIEKKKSKYLKITDVEIENVGNKPYKKLFFVIDEINSSKDICFNNTTTKNDFIYQLSLKGEFKPTAKEKCPINLQIKDPKFYKVYSLIIYVREDPKKENLSEPLKINIIIKGKDSQKIADIKARLLYQDLFNQYNLSIITTQEEAIKKIIKFNNNINAIEDWIKEKFEKKSNSLYKELNMIDVCDENEAKIIFEEFKYDQEKIKKWIKEKTKKKKLEAGEKCKICGLKNKDNNNQNSIKQLRIESFTLINKIKKLDDENKNNVNKKANNNREDLLISLMEKIDIKDREIERLKKALPFDLKDGEEILPVIFISSDQKVHYSVICKNSEKFNFIENRLYDAYPQYKENENFFTVNGAKIIKSNTLKENKIKYSDIIMMIPLED